MICDNLAMSTSKQTFHIFLRSHGGSGSQQRITRMAIDHETARQYGEEVCIARNGCWSPGEGWVVEKVRRAPTTPADNLSRKGK